MQHPGSIHILPPELQNQIAAGEVVERPASVVKELVENSLDAGGERIDVSIEGGGQSLIRVQDNGQGLDTDEIGLALTRHATSKVRSVEDLQRISSFGFRGEALPSIASVARLALTSIKAGMAEGSQVQVEFGHVIEQRPAPLREGTTIEVRDLFVNTPARLKFLKKQATEQKKCQEVLQRFALANLSAAFSYTAGGRHIFSFDKGQTLQERLAALWPPQIVEQLCPISLQREEFSVSGLAGSPSTAQGRADRILLFVNRRPVQDKLLLSAVRQAYKGRLLSREYPQVALFVDLPAEAVDVNVHPAKSEVRFQDEQRIASLVVKALQQALEGFTPEPASAATGRQPDHARTPPSERLHSLLNEESNRSDPRLDTGHRLDPISSKQVPASFESAAGRSRPGSQSVVRESPAAALGSAECEYLGQLEGSYLLLRDGGSLVIVDQHAAHERILFNGLRDAEQSPEVQRLALPLDMNLHPSEQTVFERLAPRLQSLGFLYDWPRREVVHILGIPAFLSSAEARDFLRTALSEGPEDFDTLWTLLACKRAVKAGDPLSPDEALHLLKTWLSAPDREHCPHGRPIAVRFSPRDLDKLFKR
jgi:DNA mismatch repair protein MutL